MLGPLIGLVVLALAALLSRRIGALGGYSELVERTTGRISGFGWKAWFLFGIFGGALVFRLIVDPTVVSDGYGWLSQAFGDDALVLIGYGAKTAGGCTSGNGLGGCSAGSPASFAATATFMGTAIVVSFLTEAIFL